MDNEESRTKPELAAYEAVLEMQRLLSEPGGASEALRRLRQYDPLYSHIERYQHDRAGILIDCGSDLLNRSVIEEGVKALEASMASVACDSPSRPFLQYNLANGYYALARLLRLAPDTSSDLLASKEPDAAFREEHCLLEKAKHYYREALCCSPCLSEPAFLAQAWTNYGNTLDLLGRSIEGMAAYRKALGAVPEHAMAMGNLGIALERFAPIAGSKLPLIEARDALASALATPDVERLAGPEAREAFREALDRVSRPLDGVDVANVLPEMSVAESGAASYEDGYVEFCCRHGLLLNLCLGCRRCSVHQRDTVLLSLTTALDDETTYPCLARVVNETKERFASARWQLYAAVNPRHDPLPINRMTTYAYNLDYALYGIQPGLVKLAFEGACSILDKIALFLNWYLDLGIQEKWLCFVRMWQGSKKLSVKLERGGDRHLWALYDIAQDLGKDGYLQHLVSTRNASHHRYVVPHIEPMGWLTEADGEEYHLAWDELVEQAFELMTLVKSAIIYLVAFIQQEEANRHTPGEKGLLPRVVPTYDPTLFQPPRYTP
jgi:tetratricopeptide (TPR) repeat protein